MESMSFVYIKRAEFEYFNIFVRLQLKLMETLSFVYLRGLSLNILISLEATARM